MNIKDRALDFAIRALESEKAEIQSILQTISIGDILTKYNFNDEIIAAGYLYMIQNKTNFNTNDIARLFGGEIASLLLTAIEINPFFNDKIKREQKKVIKDLPENNRVIIVAALIVSLNSIIEQDFENQKLYFQSLFEVLENDFNHTILNCLYEEILRVFYKQMGNGLQITTLKSSPQKELSDLKNLLQSSKSYIIEFVAFDKHREVNLSTLIKDFVRTNGITIKITDEATNRNHIIDTNSMNAIERNFLIASEVEARLLSKVANNNDVFLISQGLFNRLIWFKRFIEREEGFEKNIYKYLNNLENNINYVAFHYSKDIKHEKNYQPILENLINLLDGNTLIDVKLEIDSAIKMVENLMPIIPSDCKKEIRLFLEMKKTA